MNTDKPLSEREQFVLEAITLATERYGPAMTVNVGFALHVAGHSGVQGSKLERALTSLHVRGLIGTKKIDGERAWYIVEESR